MKKAALVVFLALVILAAIDVIDLHVCGGKVCIARAGNCHICETRP